MKNSKAPRVANAHKSPPMQSVGSGSSGSAIYALRQTEDLGEHYVRHAEAMTREGLHSKSAIAAELAYRDSLLQLLLDVSDNCDETGYVDGVGFFDIDALHDQVRALLR
jgi:hypothetical protein